MDAYSMCYTTSSSRGSSRIYQDLGSSRFHSLAGCKSGGVGHDMTSREGFQEPYRQRRTGSSSPPHIAIVGAGLSGLRCADILLQHGFRVTILEGRDRVGGRVHQQKLSNGRIVDLGPNWIHGTDDNPILDLAKETETALGNWDNFSNIFDESGYLMSEAHGDEVSNMMWGIIQDAFKHSNAHCAKIHPKESLLDFFNTKLNEKLAPNEAGSEEKRKRVLQLAEAWGAYVGNDISTQSLKFFWLEECIEGENLLVAGTYQKILQTIAKPALVDAEIRFSTKATRISYKRQAADSVRITTDKGDTLKFDEVVVTAPLGWLKRNLAAFDPPLPGAMTKAISSIGYGCLEKVYITFPKAFWLPSDDKGRKVLGFAQWLSPNYASETNPRRWNQEVVELAGADAELAHPTLLFYLYGDQSKFVTSQLSKLQSEQERIDFLKGFFRPYYSRLPQYSPDDPDCQPAGCLGTDWLNDEMAGHGSYCNFQVGLEEGDSDIRAMREGLPQHGLWLAGEHTAPFVALGTTTGAYWSGEAVGRRLAEAYGRSQG